METPSLFTRHNFQFEPGGVAVVALGVGSGIENVAATVIHDHVMYPTQVTEDRSINRQLKNTELNSDHLRQDINALQGADAVLERHGVAIPQTVQAILSADKAGVRNDQLQATQLQHERPDIPVSTNELFGGLLLATAVAGVGIAMRRIRRHRREGSVSALQVDVSDES